MVLDDTWVSAPRRRSRTRLALLVLLAATLLFWAGVEVQQRYGVSDGAAAAGPAGAFSPPTGVLGGPGQDTGGDTTSGDGQSSVIGTVVSVKGDVWIVKDFGGKTHRIRVGADARVVRETAADPADVASGTTVAVSGTPDDQGDLTATTVTLRGGPE